MMLGFVLLASVPLAQGQGWCIGPDWRCAQQADCRSCEFINAGCEWRLFGGEPGDFCAGSDWSCQGKSSCMQCESYDECTWVASIQGPRPRQGRCIGTSIHCPGETDCKGCNFWSGCHWEITPEERGDTCIGSSIHCNGQTECGDCEFWSGCQWTPTCRGSSQSCDGKYSDDECECFPECTWGHQHQAGVANYTLQCVGSSSWCAQYDNCFTCGNAAGHGCKWARVPKGESPHFCDERPDGQFCDGQYVRQCQGRKQTNTDDCQNEGCVAWQGGAGCFCSGKSPGKYCDGTTIKECPSGGSSQEMCRGGIQCAQGQPGQATCGTADLCSSRAPGTYCDGPYLKSCLNGQETYMRYCGTCNTVSDTEGECGTPRLCETRGEGWHCDGDNIIKLCTGNENYTTPTDQRFCNSGCERPPQWMQPSAGDRCIGQSGPWDGYFVGAAALRRPGALLGLASALAVATAAAGQRL